jgi:hypothetical protein
MIYIPRAISSGIQLALDGAEARNTPWNLPFFTQFCHAVRGNDWLNNFSWYVANVLIDRFVSTTKACREFWTI